MRRGFTLIELLVVITVIAILAGLLIPLISIALQKAHEAKTQAKIANISAAITKYRDANGGVPDRINVAAFTGSTSIAAADMPTDDYSITFGTTAAPKKLSDLATAGEAPWEDVARNVVAQLGTVDRDNFRTIDDFRDSFGAGIKSKVFRYRPARYYPLVASGNGGAASVAPADYPDCDDPPNPDTFQLWSAGPNGKDENGTGDDLPNWKKKK